MATSEKEAQSKKVRTLKLAPGNNGQRVNQVELAALVGVTARQLRDDAWKTCPVERTGSVTFYNTKLVFEWARASGTLAMPMLDDEDSKEDARRLIKAKADKEEYEAERRLFMLAKLRRDVLSREVIEDLLNRYFTTLRQTVLERTNRYAERIVEVATPEEARALVDKMNAELLTAIASNEFTGSAMAAAMDTDAEAAEEEGSEEEGMDDADE